MIRDFFLQRAAIEISFDVRWSLVAQAVPENKPFLQKMSIFRNRYLNGVLVNISREVRGLFTCSAFLNFEFRVGHLRGLRIFFLDALST